MFSRSSIGCSTYRCRRVAVHLPRLLAASWRRPLPLVKWVVVSRSIGCDLTLRRALRAAWWPRLENVVTLREVDLVWGNRNAGDERAGGEDHRRRVLRVTSAELFEHGTRLQATRPRSG